MRRVIHINSSSGIGGGESHLLLLARYLHGEDFQFEFILPQEGVFCDRLHSAGLSYQIIPMVSKFSWSARAQVRRTLGQSRPDLVHCHGARANWYGRTSANRAGVGVIFSTVHNSLRDYPYPEGIRKLYVKLENRTANLVTQWIAVSNSIKADLVDYYHLPRARIEVIPNGIDLCDLQPKRSRAQVLEEFQFPHDAFLLVAAARMSEQKGHRYLLAAIAQIYRESQNVFCLLAGDGPLRRSLEREAHRLGIWERIHFAGFRRDMPDLLAAADAYVLPSISEGMPMGLLEAMAMGRPVIATAVSGVPEVIRHRTDGLMIPPADVDSLSHAIREMMADPSLRQGLAERGRHRVATSFTAEKMASRVAELYRVRLAEIDL